ncbi:MAG: hypothetical protein ACRC62_13190 [Microcoleus sp.]
MAHVNCQLSTNILRGCIRYIGAGVKHSDLKLAIYFRSYRPNALPLQVYTIDPSGQNITTLNFQL